MKNSAWIIAVVCAFVMPFITRGWWQSVVACLLLGVVNITTEALTKRAIERGASETEECSR